MIISKLFQQDIAIIRRNLSPTSIDILVIVNYYLANKDKNQLKGLKSYFIFIKIHSFESFLKLAPNLGGK